jgi:mutator protein MutT
MDRRYPQRPLVGVGAIIFRENEVLLIRRSNPPGRGKWSLPGGLVELGERLEDAVKREVFEEAGLEVRVIDLVTALDRVILDREGRIEYHYILLDFLCEITNGNVSAGTDADECRFVVIDDLPRFELTRGTLEVIKRVFENAGRPDPAVYSERKTES